MPGAGLLRRLRDRDRGRRRSFVLLVALVVGLTGLSSTPALASMIKVTTTSDEYGSGSACSLREAIVSANGDTGFGGCTAGSGADTITLLGGKRYIRELSGAEDANAGGDYDISGKLTIVVKGSGNAELDAGGLDRVLQILPGASLTASHLTITNGYVAANQPGNDTSGGGILDGGTLDLRRSVVVKNETLGNMNCTCGGGIAVSGVARLDRVRILGNRADNIGGGIAWLGGELKVDHSTIAGNTAGSSGGGLYLGADVGTNSASFENSTISGNTQLSSSGNQGGGGFFVSDFANSKLTARNVTIAGNTAYGSGGGVWLYAGQFTLTSATVARNFADKSGGTGGHGGGLSGSGVSARNSIVVLNHDLNPTDPSDDCFISGGVQSGLVGKGTGCDGQNRTTSSPGLRALGDYGGPTQTFAITGKSPAVGHASKPSPRLDQRGRRRDRHPDIGAFELIPKRHHHRAN